MKNIQITATMNQIIAIDSTEEQTIVILRQQTDSAHMDSDPCTIVSYLVGDSEPQTGTTTWREAFADIQRLFNLTTD